MKEDELKKSTPRLDDVGQSLLPAVMSKVFVRMEQHNFAPDDYMENGVRMCAKCHTPKQAWVNFPVRTPEGLTTTDESGETLKKPWLAPIACRCRREALAQEREQDKEMQFRSWMHTHQQYGISGGLSKDMTFDADDGRDPMALEICRRYVDNWRKMYENNIGIIFHGPNGTGKSFHAGMIVNELLKRRIPCLMTSFPSLLAAMEKWGEKQEIVDHLRLFELVVIDDLGAERSSSYALEQIYHVVDARYRQRKPLIVTTNTPVKWMKMDEEGERNLCLKKDADPIMIKRIFSRVLEMCSIKVGLNGIDRRTIESDRKKRLAEAIMRGESL